MSRGKEYLSEITDKNGSERFNSDRWFDWGKFTVSLKRSNTFYGVVSSFTSTVTYVKNIRERLLNLFDDPDGGGVNAEAELVIKISNDNGERNSYQQVGDGSAFSLDFSAPGIDEQTFQLNAKESAFQNKFFTRRKEKINFDKDKNMDGGDMSPCELQNIIIPDRTIRWQSQYSMSSTEDTLVEAEDKYVTIPLNLTYESDDNFKVPTFIVSDDINSADSFFYLQSDKDRSIDFKFNINFDFNGIVYGVSEDVSLIFRTVDVDFVEVSKEIIKASAIPRTRGIINFQFIEDRTIEVIEGQSLQIILAIGGSTYSAVAFQIDPIQEKNVLFGESVEENGQTETECIYPLELFERFTEFVTGEKNAFYSDLFGRTDRGYSVDGEWSRVVALNGKMIRGFPFDLNPFNTTFEEAFKEYHKAIGPLGLAIEYVGGKKRIRIEKYDDFIDDEVILDLGSITSSPKRMVNSERLFTTVIVGGKDIVYEEVNGVSTTHGEMNLTTPYKGKDKKLDLKMKWRTGDYDIHFAQILPYIDNPTLDSKYDKNNYLIDAYISGGKLVARQSELFQLVTGILAPEKATNLRLTPKRMALRHGAFIKESFTRSDSKYLIYTKGSSNQELITQLIEEDVPVIEKDDILIADLQRPKLLGELFTFSVPFDLEQFNLLSRNRNKMITFTDISNKRMYGPVWALKFKEPSGEAEITIIRANR